MLVRQDIWSVCNGWVISVDFKNPFTLHNAQLHIHKEMVST